MNIKNFHIPGSELALEVCINTDKAIVGKVIDKYDIEGGSIVTFCKAWDEIQTQFKALSDFRPQIGSYIVAYRTGDFDSGGSNGFELHAKDVAKTSWYIPRRRPSNLLQIEVTEQNRGIGKDLYNGDLYLELPLVPVTNGSLYPVDNLQNSYWVRGEKLFGLLDLPNERYLVFAAGYGSQATTKSVVFCDPREPYKKYTITVQVDATGNIVGLTGSLDEPTDFPPTVEIDIYSHKQRHVATYTTNRYTGSAPGFEHVLYYATGTFPQMTGITYGGVDYGYNEPIITVAITDGYIYPYPVPEADYVVFLSRQSWGSPADFIAVKLTTVAPCYVMWRYQPDSVYPTVPEYPPWAEVDYWPYPRLTTSQQAAHYCIVHVPT